MRSIKRPLCVLVAALALGAACAPAPRAEPTSASAPAERAAPSRSSAADAPSPTALEKVRIGYPSRSVTFLSMLLARDQGYYQEQGLDVEAIQIKTNIGITALLNGEVEYTESVGTNIRSALQGAPIKTV